MKDMVEIYRFRAARLLPYRRREGLAALIQGQGLEGVLDVLAYVGVVEGVFFHVPGEHDVSEEGDSGGRDTEGA